MAESPTSILFADIGAAATKVGLLGLVAGQYRILGATRTPTTAAAPYHDVMVGVRQAIMQLQALTGRRLLDRQGDLIQPARADGDGADAFTAVASAAMPLRTAVIGLSRDYSVTGALRAVNSAYAFVEHTIAVDEESGRWGTTAQAGRAGGSSDAVEKLALLQPDVIIMVGGTDGGAVTPLLEMANIVAAIGAALDPTQRPPIIFAGNQDARSQVAERIGSLMELRAVDNVLPALDRLNPGPLQTELENIYRQQRVEKIPGLAQLTAWAPHGILTAADSFTRIAEYLAHKFQLRVLAIDLGAGATTLIHADEAQLKRAIFAEWSVGYGLAQLVDGVGMEKIMRWLPPSFEVGPVHAQLLNQALHPTVTPTRWHDLTALNAAGRELLIKATQLWQDDPALTLRDSDLILLTGAPLAQGSKPAALLLMLLDALDVRGIYSVAADTMGLAPALGAVASLNAEAAAQALESDCLVTWGTVFVPELAPRSGEPIVLNVQVQPARGGRLEAEIKYGSLELIPLGEGEKAQVELRGTGSVRWGKNGTVTGVKNNVFKREVQGGTAGLLIDARGRPLPFIENLERQRDKAQEWMWEAGA